MKLDNPSIPYNGPIKGGLKPGMSVYFKGTVNRGNIKRFHINLQADCDRTFHFNPRFTVNAVVFNSYRQRRWEKEERVQSNPFRKGETFEVVFNITTEGYEVKVDGNDFYTFKHRLPVQSVTGLQLAGDASFETVIIQEGEYGAVTQQVVTPVAVCPPPKKTQVPPHVEYIYGGLWPGMSVYFKGTVAEDAKRFSINLNCGVEKGSNTAFHFKGQCSNNWVVCNSCREGKWETEEKPSDMPFAAGQDFEMMYFITSEGYQVNVNGKSYYMFRHRMNLEDVTSIKIGGDVSMESIYILENRRERRISMKKMEAKLGEKAGMAGYLRQAKILVPAGQYVTSLPGGLKVGTYMYFRGTVPRTADRFHISLEYFGRKDRIKAFHFQPQLCGSKMVSFNTYKKKQFQKEETVKEVPFRKGEKFEILFYVDRKGYQVFVNGCSLYMFKHRVPFNHVSNIEVGGDVSMELINIVRGGRRGTEGFGGLRTVLVQKVPHLGPIYGGLRVGSHLYFCGRVPKDAKRFIINFQYGQIQGSFIALQFKAQFMPSEMVTLNSNKSGKWEKEEKVNKMPFKRGEAFELIFIVTNFGYRVIVNGRPFCLFAHRLPAHLVSAIKMGGDVKMQNFKIIRGVQGALELYPRLQTMTITKIPHTGMVYGGVRVGMVMFFQGTVPNNSKSFVINFQLGTLEGCNRALQFRPQFEPEGAVVFNSWLENNPGVEEKAATMPFTKGGNFELVFIFMVQGIQVVVNGRCLHMYKHRMPVADVNAINIDGEVSMESVTIEESSKLSMLRQPGLKRIEISSIPFVENIHGWVRTGLFMYFRGTIPQDANRFDINLQDGRMEGCDIGFNISPRFECEGMVVCNSFEGGEWKEEERIQRMPFQKGQEFEMVIIVKEKGYQVFVNGRQCHFFRHRLPVQEMTALNVVGEVTMQPVTLIQGGQGLRLDKQMVVTKIPHVAPIYGGLTRRTFLFFRGTVPEDVKSFSIDLQCGEMEDCDKALRFQPIFAPSEMVVFKHFKNGDWLSEEKILRMPFQKGKDFELVFVITSTGYHVLVNGCLFHFFRHCMPVEHVSAIKIDGNVTMQTVDTIGEEDDEEDEPDSGKLVIPAIPYVGPTPRALRTGMAIYVLGEVPENSTGFAINLQYGQMEGCDKTLHVNPRFEPCGVVVLNSFRCGSWEKELTVYKTPFAKGESFEMVILIKPRGYQIRVNGEEFYFFEHRMPLAAVNAIQISGEVSIENFDMVQEEPEIPEEMPEKEKSIPSVGPFYSGLKTGMSVIFTGTVPKNAHRFAFNLQCGDAGSDIAWHFNPRFDNSTVVCNAYQNDTWEEEDVVKKMPFTQGETFEMILMVTSMGYKVNINGSEFHTFPLRTAPEQVRYIKTVGDVTVNKVSLIEAGQEGAAGQLSWGSMVVNRLPLVERIFSGLKKGMYIYFRGRTDDDFNSFQINLQCGQREDCEKALRFQALLEPTERVLFNSYQDGHWCTEEKVDVMPFRKGENFEVVFIITPKGYQVIINGCRFYLFAHRLPAEQVSFLGIDGDVTIESINTMGSGPGSVQGYRGLRKIFVTKIPHTEHIYGGLRTGTYMYFHGTVAKQVKSFHISQAIGTGKTSDIALNFKVQFEPKARVECNSYQNLKWGKPDIINQMPFKPGEDFELLFVLTSENYQVIINGRHFHTVPYCMPVDHVGVLNIGGQVTMKTVNMIRGGEGYVVPSLRKMIVSKVPYVGPVYGGFRPGMYVYFRGTTPQEMKSFAIDLQYGQREGSDIALRFNPQCEPSEAVVFKSFRNGSWDVEEKVETMPLTRGEEFEVLFITTSRGYQVIVNGCQFYFYEHRMPVWNVNAINIAGDVSVQNVNMMEEGQDAEEEPAQQEITIPYMHSVQGGFRTGMYQYFKGTVLSDAKSFTINMQNAGVKGSDIAMQFKSQFEPTAAVLFNSCTKDVWGTEQQVDKMPFAKGEPFEIFFFITTTGYEVIVNGHSFHHFPHRMAIDQVSAVNVTGDVSIQTVSTTKRGPAGVPGQPAVREVVVTKMPHVGPVIGGLMPGMFLFFKGIIPHSTESFGINLKYGEMKDCDKAFCFTTHFTPKEAVEFKTFKNNKWENEERLENVMPFRKGANFELLLTINAEGYQVFVNGRKLHLYPHHMPVEYVTAVEVTGDIAMQTIRTVTRPPVGQPGHPGLGKMEICKLPHVGPVVGGLRKGMVLYFRGNIPENMNRFSIDLQYSQMDGCDKALHFCPQFIPDKVVLLNTFRNGVMEKEMKIGNVPFVPGEKFELAFVVTSKGYKVKVNGRRFCTFPHRMPWEYVTAIKIGGDVTMETGEITEGGEDEEEEKIVPGISTLGPIIGGLRFGSDLHLSGTVPQNPKSFSVNLLCGDTEGSDTAFQFKPQFDTSEVVCNTSVKNSWGEQVIEKQMPFEAGEDFDMIIRVQQKGYQVVVNDNDFLFFNHRASVVDVTSIKITGDVFVHNANILEGGRIGQGQLVVNKMPYFGPIPLGLKTGTYLYFRGKMDDDINRFSINLECGEKECCEKALHFEPQFQPLEIVTFNSFLDNEWGKPEKVDMMPFRKGENFEVVFIVTANEYQVIVNGCHFYNYKHRIPVQRVSAIKIHGDAIMEPIKMTGTTVEGYRGLHKMVVNKIPFVGPVFSGLKTGMFMYFKGTVPNDVDSFEFNAQYGESKNSDIALHFRPQFTPTEAVIFNSKKKGVWQTEEKVDKMPFTKGQNFEVLFIVTPEHYKVIVNGRQFYEFKHRISVQYVNAIKILGKVTMQTINTIGGGEGIMHPSLAKMVVSKIPYVGPVYGGLSSGMFALFRGTVPQESKSFAINLQYGQIEGSDTALHFSPQFEPSEAVIINTYKDGDWGEEVKIGMMPFTKGQDFEVVFMITPVAYQVYINGRHFYCFEHRMPVEHVSAVNITGEVTMQFVDMTTEGKGAPTLPAPGPVVISTTPHVERILCGLKPGTYLYLEGTIPQVIKSFDINLQYGEIEGADTALQFKAQFEPAEEVLFSSFQGGERGEPVKPAQMPFSRGQDFEMVIIVLPEGYQVNVNGQQLQFYEHRMPAEQVNTVKILGDVSMKHINIVQKSQIETVTKMEPFPPTPQLVPTFGGLWPGMYMYFKGTIPQEMKSFFINLQYGQPEGSDVAFSFKAQSDPSEVVMNTHLYGTWGAEDKIEKMPFTKGEEFELLFLITSEGYQVNANGSPFGFFPHRMPVEQVSFIRVDGDVSMQSLVIIKGGALQRLGKLNIPQTPHVEPLYGGLVPGMALSVRGTVPEKAERFTIDLQYGQLEGSDIALSSKIQLEPSEEFVFNSFLKGELGEPMQIEDVPLEPGVSFDLAFIVTEEAYQVVLDARRIVEFPHRMAVNQVSALKITGDIIVDKVSIIGGAEVEIKPEPQIIPDVDPVSEPLTIGRALILKGTVPCEITSFAVNLRCGDTEDSDIAFQLKSQYEPSESVALNTRQGGNWGEEKTVDSNPFTEGESFELAYIITENEYQVKVNGSDFCMYPHRIPVDQVKYWQFIGEVVVQTPSFVNAEELEPVEPEEVITLETPTPNGVLPGTLMVFIGMIPPDSKRFGMNFMSGEIDRAFSLNVLFEPSVSATLNSVHDGNLGEEVSVPVEQFQRGATMAMVFVVTKEGYEVTVNGVQLSPFKHRLPFESVSSIRVTGDVTNHNLSMEMPAAPRVSMVVQSEKVLTDSLTTGTTLTFQGVVSEEARMFSIDLRLGDEEGSDTAFHFSPQFETSEVLLNTCQNETWGTVVKVDKNPFTRGEKFVVVFTITENHYQVLVNGTEFYCFPIRIPIDQVKALQIAGDVTAETPEIETVEVYPSPAQLGTIQSETTVSKTWEMETSLIFQGVIPEEITRFSINLLCGNTKDSDIAFHFSPQFETSDVVLNTYKDKCWGTAQKVDKLPFKKGDKFEIVYTIKKDGYQVNVDGEEFAFYEHVIPIERVKFVQVAGDVRMKIVDVKEPVTECPLPTKIAPVQCVAVLKSPLQHEWSLTFEGIMPSEISRFCLNLQCGMSEDSDAAFNINLLFDTSEVEFNSVVNRQWGVAEKVAQMPFVKGEKFCLLINIVAEGYEVMVNNQFLHLFNHRMPLEKVTCLQVIGDAPMQISYLIKATVREYPVPVRLGPVQSVTSVEQSLKTGLSLVFEGTIQENITCFCINLQCGAEEGCDTALHFSPQFDKSQVLINSFQNGCWDQAVRITEMPFCKGQCFKLLFNIISAGYQIKVNGNDLCTFEHRIAVEKVTAIQLLGDVQMEKLTIIESAPAIVALPGGLASGTTITLQGIAPNESTGFSIDLLCGTDEGSDKAFQFKAQFEPPALVFNSCQNGAWGAEEVINLPFARGEDFDIVLIITPDHYQVQVEDEDVHCFKHRIGSNQVRALQISGNVNMPTVNIVEGNVICPSTFQAVQYTGAIPAIPIEGALKAETSMTIQFSIPESIPSFAINLMCGEGQEADNALRFKAEFEPSESLVLNSFIRGCWGQETVVTPMPFQRGTSYELDFFVSEEGYKVKVNDNEIGSYEHRIAVDQVKAIQIDGNINLQGINFIERSMHVIPGSQMVISDDGISQQVKF